jgi:hypothetical protein
MTIEVYLAGKVERFTVPARQRHCDSTAAQPEQRVCSQSVPGCPRPLGRANYKSLNSLTPSVPPSHFFSKCVCVRMHESWSGRLFPPFSPFYLSLSISTHIPNKYGTMGHRALSSLP